MSIQIIGIINFCQIKNNHKVQTCWCIHAAAQCLCDDWVLTRFENEFKIQFRSVFGKSNQKNEMPFYFLIWFCKVIFNLNLNSFEFWTKTNHHKIKYAAAWCINMSLTWYFILLSQKYYFPKFECSQQCINKLNLSILKQSKF